MPAFPKEAIAEILQSLDHKDDALWTDDGSPLVSEIQRLANDKTITRAQINDAIPGFARKSADSVAEDEQPNDEVDEGTSLSTDTIAPPVSEGSDEDGELSPEQEHERLRGLAYQRVRDAELAIVEAKNHVAEAHRAVHMAEQRLTRAMQVYSAKYPPLTVAENIKQHLARQQETLRERITGIAASGLNPLDEKMMDRKRDNGRKGRTPAPFLPRKISAASY